MRKFARQVVAGNHFSYAVTTDGVYSWGFGENYVLGNRDDNNEFTPYKLDPKMFEHNHLQMLACGTNHCVAITSDGTQPKKEVHVE